MASVNRFRHDSYSVSAMLLSTLVVQGFLTWLSYVIYETLVTAFGSGLGPLEWIFVLFSFTFLTATLIAHKTARRAARAYYWLAARWFACLVPLFGGSVLFVLIERLGPFFGLDLPPLWAGIFSFALAGAVIVYGFWEAAHVVTTRITVALPNLPPEWQGKTLVFMSDLHLDGLNGAGFAGKIARRVAALCPEVVFVGGDLYEGLSCDAGVFYEGLPCHAGKLIASFNNLKAPRGLYFITGNHEYLGTDEHLLAAVRGAGIRVLNNEVVDLGGLQLAGVDYRAVSSGANYAAVLENMKIDASKPSILLKHVPSRMELAAQKGFSLQLSGHTHHGQIWPLPYLTRRLFHGYDYGLKQFGAMAVYTSSGAGTWGPPFRFWTKSEIVAITLESKK